MGVITYTAERNITGGRSQGNTYDLEIEFARYLPDMQSTGDTRVSMSGKRETIEIDWWTRYQITIGPVTGTDLDQTREFVASVLFGEAFNIDLYGTVGSPDNPITVRLDQGQTPRPQRENNTAYFTYSFIAVAR